MRNDAGTSWSGRGGKRLLLCLLFEPTDEICDAFAIALVRQRPGLRVSKKKQGRM